MNIKRSMSTIAAAGLLVLAAGCGSVSPPNLPSLPSLPSAPVLSQTAPTPQPAAGAGATACELLTVQDVQSVLGVATTTQATAPAKIATACAYLAGGSRALFLTVSRSRAVMSPAQTMTIFMSDGPGASPVSGIGEAAVYLPKPTNPNASGGQLVFAIQRGDQMVLVNLSTFREKITQEQFVALARLAAQRV